MATTSRSSTLASAMTGHARVEPKGASVQFPVGPDQVMTFQVTNLGVVQAVYLSGCAADGVRASSCVVLDARVAVRRG